MNYILDGQTVMDIDGLKVSHENALTNTCAQVIDKHEDTMPKTKEAAIDYLHEIGWFPEHDKLLSPKEGSWVKSDKYKGYSVCSVCRDCYVDSAWISSKKWNFCPSCGAHMTYKEILEKPDFTNYSGQLTSPDCHQN